MSTKSTLLLVILQTLFCSVISAELRLEIRQPLARVASTSCDTPGYYLTLEGVCKACSDVNAYTCAAVTGLSKTCKSENGLTATAFPKQCRPCAKGYHSQQPAIDCFRCAAGFYAKSGMCMACNDPFSVSCEVISDGTVSSTLCRQGYGFSPTLGSNRCSLCQKGTKCDTCPIGMIIVASGNLPCQSCALNQYTGNQQAICQNCLDINAAQCNLLTGVSTVCQPGFVLNTVLIPNTRLLKFLRRVEFVYTLHLSPNSFSRSKLASRISLKTESNLYFGTIKYEGLVLPTKGNWLGVEWDDSSRGKHDGVYSPTRVRYFECRIPGSGSFIRPQAAGLSYGISFSDAIKSKYLGEGETESTEEKEEGSTFYETISNFKIEVVSLVKIKELFKQLHRLKEIGLEREGVNGVGLNHQEITNQLSRLDTLSLSFSLLPSFQAVAEIVQSIPTLRNLELKFNPLQSPQSLSGLSHLTSLHLNKTLITWSEILFLSPSLSSLEDLQLGFNQITSLSTSNSTKELYFPKLHTLNLDSNFLTNFSEVLSALENFPSLVTLILSSNRFNEIRSPPLSSTTSNKLSKVRYLNLSDNLLKTWEDLDHLSLLIPKLEGLWFGLNPLMKVVGEENERSMVLARMSNLISYEGSQTRSTERADAELFYLSTISKEEGTREQKQIRHPRFEELLTKYEDPASSATSVPKVNNLKSKLITLHIIQNVLPTSPKEFTLSILPTIATRLLRTQIAKLLNLPTLPANQFALVALLRPSEEDEEEVEREGEEEEEIDRLRIEIPIKEEARQLEWWGLRDDDVVELVER